MTCRSLLWTFPAAVTIHNAEEAFSMPAWVSAHRGQLPFHPGTSFIRMALLLATLAAFAVKGRESIWTHLYFGGAATMLINVFVPHLPATLLFRHYTPGVVTAVLINLPLNTLLLYKGRA